MPPNDGMSQTIRVRVTKSMKQAVEDAASRRGEKPAVIVRQAIREFLEEMEGVSDFSNGRTDGHTRAEVADNQ